MAVAVHPHGVQEGDVDDPAVLSALRDMASAHTYV